MVLSKQDKINESQIQLNNKDHYMPLEQLMVVETNRKGTQLGINKLYCKNHIDEMTKKMALSNTRSASNSSILHPNKNT